MAETISAISILVVDDSNVQQDHLVKTCQAAGLSQIARAENGVDALDQMKELRFDLVFVDLEMPVMDGVELVRQIASQDLADSVIILSSKDPALIASIGTMAESDGLQVLGCFQKPMKQQQIEQCLVRILNPNKQSFQKGPAHHFEVNDLINAIDEQQITLYYQPKLTSATIEVAGVEALARWIHPQYGFISPLAFIDMAEKHQLIERLTFYLFKKGIEQKNRWKKDGHYFHLAFNLSPFLLENKNISQYIIQTCRAHEIDPDEIVFEVTENALSENLAQSIQTLAKLRLQGYNIAIDDFGTGYANAQQLSRVPANELKLDRVMVDNASSNKQQKAILTSTVALAKELRLEIVAEGVEQYDDYLLLRDLEVDLIQGYFFCRPIPDQELINWITSELPSIQKQYR